MKMVCKKLLSLVLVALMLVSAIPFQASAAERQNINVVVKHNEKVEFEVSFEPDSDQALVSNILAYHVPGEYQKGELVKIYSSKIGDVVTLEDSVDAGDTITFKYAVEEVPDETTKPTEPAKPADITWEVKHNGQVKESGSFTPDGDTSNVANILEYKVPSRLKVGKLTEIWSNKKQDYISTDDSVDAGDKVTFNYTIKEEPVETTKPKVDPIKVVVKVNNSDNVVFEGSKVPANGEYATVQDLLTYVWNSDWDNAYTYHHAWSHEQQKNLSKSGKVYAGDTLYIALERKSTSGGSGSGSGSDGGSSKFPYSVYLHIYAKGNVNSPMKTVTLDTWTCVKDGVITIGEVKEVVKTYYTAKDSDGIGYDGFYYSTSSTKNDYINDKNKTDRIDNLDELRKEGYVHLNIWIDNAKAKSDSNADSSNPKTGDSIFVATTVMGLSAASLAAVYYISKKRAVR